ncbi:hypothetical protein B0H66DRAFT_566289 [Apodospora peruviana]|uniref:Uncharacterized protein n=1 Tax=Apodospora peruviana TaxID=516989 RepID=A0AAE0HV33_9PEZI|nr:hypothetical protein B0H66DRAFT_566289 [Apodospora peruviana]
MIQWPDLADRMATVVGLVCLCLESVVDCGVSIRVSYLFSVVTLLSVAMKHGRRRGSGWPGRDHYTQPSLS